MPGHFFKTSSLYSRARWGWWVLYNISRRFMVMFSFIRPVFWKVAEKTPQRHIHVLQPGSAEPSSQSKPSYFQGLWQQVKIRAVFWKHLFTITVLVAFLYIFMEWLFFVTMPSFMSVLSFSGKVVVFLLSGWEFSLICIIVLAVFIIIDFLAILTYISNVTHYLGWALPTVILSALILLMIDNFTYTTFKFGISTSSGILRVVYALLFVLLTGYVYFHILRSSGHVEARSPNLRSWNLCFYVSAGILVITTGLAVFNLHFDNLIPAQNGIQGQPASRYPNIILLGSDGLNANQLSVYGYYRETTPRLKELAQSSLVAENAFTNSGNSGGRWYLS